MIRLIDEYDTVYLGYPNHWNTLPVAVFSFVEGLDWTGKAIRPFCVHEGGGMGRSIADLQKACPGACVTEGLPIHGADVRHSLVELQDWLEEETEPNIISGGNDHGVHQLKQRP